MENYNIYEEVNQGGRCVVYRGRIKQSVQFVAIKRYDKKRMSQIQTDVQLMHKAKHPYIIGFYNWYETSNHIWVIVDFCSGGTLAQVLESDISLPESSIRVFGADVMHGLQYIHSKGFIMAVLTPAHIFIDSRGKSVLGGFCFSRRVQHQAMISAEDLADIDDYTACFISPELLSGETYSFNSDLWSFGCILFAMSAGAPPFLSSSKLHIIDSIRAGKVQYPERMSAELRHLISRLLVIDPTRRIGWSELLDHPFWGSMEVPSLLPLPVPNPSPRPVNPPAPKVDPIIRTETSETPPNTVRQLCTPQPSNASLPSTALSPPSSDIVELDPVSDSFFVSSDFLTNPVAGDPSIDRIVLPPVRKKFLAFQPVQLKDLEAMTKMESETLLEKIYVTLTGVSSSSGTRQEAILHTLTYCASIASITSLANGILNSNFFDQLLILLDRGETDDTRARSALVLSLAIRSATFVSHAPNTPARVDVICKACESSSDQVRRRTMALIGELLYYISCQSDESDGGSHTDVSSWSVPEPLVTCLSNGMVADSDPVVRHTSIRSIQNILAVSADMSHYFTTDSHFASLLSFIQSVVVSRLSKTDVILTDCFSLAFHMMRLDGSLVSKFLAVFDCDQMAELVSSFRHLFSHLLNIGMIIAKAIKSKTSAVLVSSKFHGSILVKLGTDLPQDVKKKAINLLCYIFSRNQDALPAVITDSQVSSDQVEHLLSGVKSVLSRILQIPSIHTTIWADLIPNLITQFVPNDDYGVQSACLHLIQGVLAVYERNTEIGSTRECQTTCVKYILPVAPSMFSSTIPTQECMLDILYSMSAFISPLPTLLDQMQLLPQIMNYATLFNYYKSYKHEAVDESHTTQRLASTSVELVLKMAVSGMVPLSTFLESTVIEYVTFTVNTETLETSVESFQKALDILYALLYMASVIMKAIHAGADHIPDTVSSSDVTNYPSLIKRLQRVVQVFPAVSAVFTPEISEPLRSRAASTLLVICQLFGNLVSNQVAASERPELVLSMLIDGIQLFAESGSELPCSRLQLTLFTLLKHNPSMVKKIDRFEYYCKVMNSVIARSRSQSSADAFLLSLFKSE